MTGPSRVNPGSLVIAADLLSDTGNQVIGLFLINLLVFKGDDPILGMVTMCVIHQAPSLLLSRFAGSGIERTGARGWLMLVSAAKCILVALFAYITSEHLLLFVYLIFIVTSLFFAIGRMSLVPTIVPEFRLVAFNARNERVAILGGIASPWIIGLMIEKWGQTSTLSLAFLLFALSIPLIGGIAVSPRGKILRADDPFPIKSGSDSHQSTLFPLKTGYTLKPYFLLLGFVLLGGGVLNLGLPLYLKNDLHIDIAQWGLIMSAFQAGAFLSTWIVPRVKTVLWLGILPSICFVSLAVAMFLLSHATALIQVAILMFFLGCGFTMLHIYWESMIQKETPADMIQKTMARLASYKGACYLATILTGALISITWGAGTFLMIGSIAVGAACFVTRPG